MKFSPEKQSSLGFNFEGDASDGLSTRVMKSALRARHVPVVQFERNQRRALSPMYDDTPKVTPAALSLRNDVFQTESSDDSGDELSHRSVSFFSLCAWLFLVLPFL